MFEHYSTLFNIIQHSALTAEFTLEKHLWQTKCAKVTMQRQEQVVAGQVKQQVEY